MIISKLSQQSYITILIIHFSDKRKLNKYTFCDRDSAKWFIKIYISKPNRSYRDNTIIEPSNLSWYKEAIDSAQSIAIKSVWSFRIYGKYTRI